MPSEFIFPKIHSFPPLYTNQPNATISTHQLDSWCQIILQYCEHYKITSMAIDGTVKYSQIQDLDTEKLPPLFEKPEISRSANNEFKKIIINYLIHKLNKAEYIDPKKPELGVFIYWRTLVEWSELLYSFVDKAGQLGTILTIYELTKSDDNGLPENLRNIDETLLVKVLKDVLIKQGKAQILFNDDNEIGGVKIV